MARQRRDTLPLPPLRIFATGTVFLTHSLLLPAHPLPGTVSRAQCVHTARGGAAAHVLALLAQLAATVPAAGDIEPMLIASLGGSSDAVRLRDALETVGVRTRYCKIWPGLGVPTAWVVHARDTDARTVINHNPLPEVSHEDFIALLGPVLAPENYVGFTPPPPPPPPPPVARDQQSPSPVSMFPNTLAPSSAPRPSMSSRPNTAPSASNGPPAQGIPSIIPSSPAPFDWLHFEGRSVRTTVANLVGIDGLARERKWRAHCVISVDLGRRAREGVQVLIPHADVVFLSSTTFSALGQPPSPPGAALSPRAILLSLARHAAPHALLVLNAGRDGAALLSLPTSEYLQSSGWTHVPLHRPVPHHPAHGHCMSMATSNGTPTTTRTWDSVESVRSGSDFWAGAAGDASFSSRESAYTQHASARSHRRLPSGESFHPMDDEEDEDEQHAVGRAEDGDEDGRQTPQPGQEQAKEDEEDLDEEGAHAAFVAGMIWALSRRVLPGPPYVPGLVPSEEDKGKDGAADLGIRWRLDECLRFATELACRKAHSRAGDVGAPSMASSGHVKERGEWDGLGEAMRRAGWFD